MVDTVDENGERDGKISFSEFKTMVLERCTKEEQVCVCRFPLLPHMDMLTWTHGRLAC